MDTQQLRETWAGPRRREAVIHGLERMLKSGLSTVAPQQLDEELLSIWFSVVGKATKEMVHTADRRLYGTEVPDKAPLMRRIEEALRWGEILDGLGKGIVEKIGFLWYADERLEEEEPDPKDLFGIVGGFSEGEKRKLEEIFESVGKSYVIFPF